MANVKTIHVGAERVKEAKIQTLKIEFKIMNMKESETIDDYAARLTGVVNKVRTFGDKFEEAYLVKKFLRSVSENTHTTKRGTNLLSLFNLLHSTYIDRIATH